MEWLLKVIWVLPIATAVIGILGIIHGIRKGGSWLVIVRDIVVTVGLTALFCMVPGILKAMGANVVIRAKRNQGYFVEVEPD